jgi:hypothetical protein
MLEQCTNKTYKNAKGKCTTWELADAKFSYRVHEQIGEESRCPYYQAYLIFAPTPVLFSLAFSYYLSLWGECKLSCL